MQKDCIVQHARIAPFEVHWRQQKSKQCALNSTHQVDHAIQNLPLSILILLSFLGGIRRCQFFSLAGSSITYWIDAYLGQQVNPFRIYIIYSELPQ